MVIGATIIWLVVVGLTLYAVFTERTFRPEQVRRVIIGGGALFPTIVLTGLLAYGLSMMPSLQSPAPEGSLRIDISAVRWWWRVSYHPLSTSVNPSSDTDQPDAIAFELANELVLPVDEPVEFKLSSEDVIHSFWIPAIGGKVDAIPGRITRLKLQPQRLGTYRGVCAEYCGEAHSQMSFIVKVVSREDFNRWFEHQKRPASLQVVQRSASPSTESIEDATQQASTQQASTQRDSLEFEGYQTFKRLGCGACHAIRGTDAISRVAPDLTHVGGRASLGAGWLPNDEDGFTRWLRETKKIKPGVEMPQFDALTPSELQSLATFLESLQ